MRTLFILCWSLVALPLLAQQNAAAWDAAEKSQKRCTSCGFEKKTTVVYQTAPATTSSNAAAWEAAGNTVYIAAPAAKTVVVQQQSAPATTQAKSSNNRGGNEFLWFLAGAASNGVRNYLYSPYGYNNGYSSGYYGVTGSDIRGIYDPTLISTSKWTSGASTPQIMPPRTTYQATYHQWCGCWY